MSIASGEVRFIVNKELDEWVKKAAKRGRAVLRPDEELEILRALAALNAELGPKTSFSKRGMANRAERIRRNALFGVVRLVEFRSDDPESRVLFQQCFGQVSIQWLIDQCGKSAPPHFYRWAFDVLPLSAKTFGSVALRKFVGSKEHQAVFEELEEEKRNLLEVRRVMES